jgi:hypothetical protein
MAEMLLIGAVAVLTFVVVLVALLLWRPSKSGDGDRFSNARRITSGWAADAGTDPARPVQGPPGSEGAAAWPAPGTGRGEDSWVKVVEELPSVPPPAVPPAAVPPASAPGGAVPEPRAADAETEVASEDPTPGTPPPAPRTRGRSSRG